MSIQVKTTQEIYQNYRGQFNSYKVVFGSIKEGTAIAESEEIHRKRIEELGLEEWVSLNDVHGVGQKLQNELLYLPKPIQQQILEAFLISGASLFALNKLADYLLALDVPKTMPEVKEQCKTPESKKVRIQFSQGLRLRYLLAEGKSKDGVSWRVIQMLKKELPHQVISLIYRDEVSKNWSFEDSACPDCQPEVIKWIWSKFEVETGISSQQETMCGSSPNLDKGQSTGNVGIASCESGKDGAVGGSNPPSRTQTNNVKKQGGGQRARRWYGTKKGLDIHHKDGNPLNNTPENIEYLTRKEHMVKDGRLRELIENVPKAHAAYHKDQRMNCYKDSKKCYRHRDKVTGEEVRCRHYLGLINYGGDCPESCLKVRVVAEKKDGAPQA